MKFKDTIAAISTAFGNAGIAIVRMSGSKSLFVLRGIFKVKGNKKRAKPENHKMYHGDIFHKNGKIIDEVLAVYFKAPNSYTTEDVVEISCHGGFITARKILDRILKEDVRLARAGEFTERAFLSGRIDLTQAEAIADIIYAKSDKAQEVAEGQLKGSLKKEITNILNKVLGIYSHTLTNIDFPEEDIPEITKKDIAKKITAPIKKIRKLLSGASAGTIYKEGLKAALVGLPNVGKSSLLNILVKNARAIVTDIPGTTRDVLEDQIEINGLLVRLFDTAGIIKTEDKIEREGIKRSLAAIKNADVILLVIEKFKDIDNFFSHLKPAVKSGLRDKKVIIIRNKVDLKKSPGKLSDNKNVGIKDIYKASAKTGRGIRRIEEALFLELQKMDTSGCVFVTNIRHKKLLEVALKAFKEAKKLAESREAEDKILVELNTGRNALEEIIGEKVSADILEKVFSRFCVGK